MVNINAQKILNVNKNKFYEALKNNIDIISENNPDISFIKTLQHKKDMNIEYFTPLHI